MDVVVNKFGHCLATERCYGGTMAVLIGSTLQDDETFRMLYCYECETQTWKAFGWQGLEFCT